MRAQSGENMVAVLPYTFGHDQWRVRIKFPENFHPHFLRIDEAVPPGFVERMRANRLPAFRFDGSREDRFHLRLLRPAFLIGREAQIAIGEQVNALGLAARGSGFEVFVSVHGPGKIRQRARALSMALKEFPIVWLSMYV